MSCSWPRIPERRRGFQAWRPRSDAEFPAHPREWRGQFDVVLFTRSLHHIPSPADAIATAHALLAPDGMLIAEEFGLDLADERTAAWFYDMESLLEAADLLALSPERKAHAAADPPVRRRAEHAHTPPLHTAAAMEVAIMSRFTRTHVTYCPYLYRTFCAGLAEDARGHRIARKLLEIEARRISEQTLAPTGLLLAAAMHVEARS